VYNVRAYWVSGRKETDVDIERTMEFILEQQARLAEQQARFAEQLAAQQANFEERLIAQEERFNRELAGVTAVLLDVATAQERTNEIVATLAERQIETEQVVKALGERLDALMIVVERHISDHK
jgi:chromosome segregation ATPase